MHDGLGWLVLGAAALVASTVGGSPASAPASSWCLEVLLLFGAQMLLLPSR